VSGGICGIVGFRRTLTRISRPPRLSVVMAHPAHVQGWVSLLDAKSGGPVPSVLLYIVRHLLVWL
jgi:hypothetical protein